QPGLLPYVLDRLAAALLVSAPPRAHPVGAADEDRLDPADVLAVDLEQLAELPAPVDRPVVEEGEREHYPALAVDRDVAAVANPGHRADQRGLELLLAALHRLPAHADRSRRADDGHAVLDPQAVVGEGVVVLAGVPLDRVEVVVG